MTITRENTGDMTATVMIAINQKDYDDEVTKVLKDYQHKANIPGFRPGKVPFGMIKKKFGKAVVADEVNKLISDSIAKYIQDEKLDILGNPIANQEKNSAFDFDTQKDFEFYFDLGLAPVFDLNLSNFPVMDRYIITVDDTMIDHYINDTRKRFGNAIHPEEVGAEDMINGEVVEIDAEGMPIKDGITKKSFIEITKLQRDSSKEILVGLKINSKFLIKPLDFFANTEEASKLLSLPKEKIDAEGIAFEFTLNDILRTEPAELDKDFFNKVYPGKEIETGEAFRAQVREEASAGFSPETDKLFFRQVNEKLLSETTIPLPDEFLKRWLLDHKVNKMTAGEIEDQYGDYSATIRWQLIEQKLLRDHEISVEEAEIRQYIKSYFLTQIPMNIADPEGHTRLDSVVDSVMKNTEQVRKINDELYSKKLLGLFKSELKTEEKEISFDEFAKLLSSLESHEHHSEHDDHEHDHEGEPGHHHNH